VEAVAALAARRVVPVAALEALRAALEAV